MADGTIKELYEAIPTELHKQMEMYKPFASLFCKTVNAEHSNLVKAIKENTALLFTPLGLTVNIISSQSTSKATNNELLLLLKQPENLSLDGKYECLAPILFTDPKNMSLNMLLKSRILLNMACLLMFRKSLLSDKKRGQPRARGELMGANCVTEGMIAGPTIMACNLLSHNTELSPEGDNTKIPYHDDFNFYLKHKALSQASQLEPAPVVPQSCSWEDDFLDEMDWDPDVPPSITPPAPVEFQPPLQADSPPVTVAMVHPPPGVSQTTSPSASYLCAKVNHQPSVSISPRSSGDVDLSAITQVHLDIGRLFLASPGAEPG
ncbi:hypothetical protein J3A83DRAFT_4373410 [Scleroderma citrinum]